MWFDLVKERIFSDMSKGQTHENLFKNVLEAIEHPFYVVNVSDYSVEIANKASGVVEGERVTCHKLTHGEDSPCSGKEHACPMEIIKKTGKPAVLEHIHKDGSGNPIYVEVHAYPIFDDDGRFVQMIEYSMDITQKKKTQHQLVDKNKELENYLYIASHDLRSPLLNIQGFSKRLEKLFLDVEQLAMHEDMPDELRQDIEKIVKEKVPKSLDFVFSSVEKMDSLINGLLQISRTGRMELKTTDIDIKELLESVKKEFEYEIESFNGELVINDLPNCKGDRQLLGQVFSNLIGNAIKYRSKKRDLEVVIKGEDKGNSVLYSVSDNGIGIPDSYLEKIWNVFYRVDPKSEMQGEGIGLNIAKRIMEKHMGELWVESKEDVGSTFFIEVPKI